MTGHSLRTAIAEACDLTNPRLSEVDWDEVAAAFVRIRAASAPVAEGLDHEGPTPRDCPECLRVHE